MTEIWKYVDQLTKPKTHKLTRENGTIEHVTVPSLLDQLRQALPTGTEAHTGTRNRGVSRTPVDISVLHLLTQISTSVTATLPKLGLSPRYAEGTTDRDILSEIRGITAAVVSTTDLPLQDRWTSRTKSWVAHATACLGQEDGGPRTRAIRGFACPNCQTTTVLRQQDGDDYRDPAVVATFSDDGLMRAIFCRACSHHWWRGTDLDHLAAAAVHQVRRTRLRMTSYSAGQTERHAEEAL